MRQSSPVAPYASVVIPVFNGGASLAGCLDALDNQTVDRELYEVIVVDDGSRDGSASIAASHGSSVVRQRHQGAASARNTGARQARGDILLFTDADCEPAPDWIEKMLTRFEDPELVGVKGAYKTRQSSLVARFAQAEFEEKYDRMKRRPVIDFVDTYSAGYRRDTFRRIGGFDPAIRYVEDQELSFRLALAGCKLQFEPAAVVYHQHPVSVWQYCLRKAQFARWKVGVLRNYPSKLVSDSYTPWTQKAQIILLPALACLSLATAAGALNWRLLLIPAVLGLLSALPLGIRAARQGWRVALVSPVLTLLRAVALGLGLLWGLTHRPRASGTTHAA